MNVQGRPARLSFFRPGIAAGGNPPAPLGFVGQEVGTICVVPHEHAHRPLMDQRPAHKPKRLVGAVRPAQQISTPDAEVLAPQADEPLDVVDLGFLGILEDDHVPELGLPLRGGQGQVVKELVDEDPVPLEARRVLDNRRCAAVLAGARHDAAQRAGAFHFFRRVDRVVQAALWAGDFLVAAHQGRGHRAGWNHERLSLETADQEGQDQSDHDLLDQLAVRLSTRRWSILRAR